MEMIFITAKANRTDSKTDLPIINYAECESMAEAGPYIGWMFSHGRTGGRRHHVKDLEALREDVRKCYEPVL